MTRRSSVGGARGSGSGLVDDVHRSFLGARSCETELHVAGDHVFFGVFQSERFVLGGDEQRLVRGGRGGLDVGKLAGQSIAERLRARLLLGGDAVVGGCGVVARWRDALLRIAGGRLLRQRPFEIRNAFGIEAAIESHRVLLSSPERCPTDRRSNHRARDTGDRRGRGTGLCRGWHGYAPLGTERCASCSTSAVTDPTST